MNSNSQRSLDEQIEEYRRQLLNQYAQTASTPAAPPAAPPAMMPPTEKIVTPSVPPPSVKPDKASGVTPADEFRRYADENPQRGILRVQTLTARSTYPVQGSKVIVSKVFESGEYVIATQETDNAGKTEGLLLPAPDRSLSEQPGSDKKPFADYKVTVIHPEFATIVAMQLPVFAGESSLQMLNMIPLAASPSGDTIEYVTTEPSDL